MLNEIVTEWSGKIDSQTTQPSDDAFIYLIALHLRKGIRTLRRV